MERTLPTGFLHNRVTKFRAAIDELMSAMYAYAMADFFVDKGLLRDLARANAWSLALKRAVFLSFEPGESCNERVVA